MALVWCDDWQWECCGDPFGLDDAVHLTVETNPDVDWLDAALGSDLASRVTHVEDHHGRDHREHGLVEEVVLQGVVRRIRKVFGRHAPQPGGARHTLYPAPGSAVLVDVLHLDAQPVVADGLRANGYLVDLDVAP